MVEELPHSKISLYLKYSPEDIPHRNFFHIFLVGIPELINVECVLFFGCHPEAEDSYQP